MIKLFRDFLIGSLSLVKGLIVTLKYHLRAAITLQYPTQRQPMVERFRGLVDLRPEKCITCYQCVRICPTACLGLTHRQEEKKKVTSDFKYNMELCCFCGLCEQVCPTSAIYMNKLYEIAVYDRKKLYINLLDPEKYREWTDIAVK